LGTYGAGVVDRLALLILRRVLFPFSAWRAGLTGIGGDGWRIAGLQIAGRLSQERPPWLIRGALSAALYTFTSLAAWVVVTDWPTLVSVFLVLLALIRILLSH
jgi:hypothetical protein